jgi:hypothetical protein
VDDLVAAAGGYESILDGCNAELVQGGDLTA